MPPTLHAEPIDLQDGHLPPVLPESPKLGRIAGHTPSRRLSDYLDVQAAAAKVPAAITRPHPGFQWGMLANDRLGDCVIAMMLHSIEDLHLDAGTAPPAFTDEDAIAAYSAITGYDPTKPETDQGTNEAEAMAYWQKTGLTAKADGSVHKVCGTLSIDPKNATEMQVGIWEFVDVQLGVALPKSAQGEQEWTEPPGGFTGEGEPGSWGGHGIPAREYDGQRYKVVTWGAELLMTVAFHDACTQEAFVIIDEEMLNNSGTGPSGVDWSQLASDFKADFQAAGH